VIAGAAQTIDGFMSHTDERRSTEARWSDEAFEAVFRAHYGRVAGVLFRLVGERARAEELASEVFWKLYRRSDVCDDAGVAGASVAAWLYRTASNLGIDALRARASRSKYEQAAAREMRDAEAASSPMRNLLRDEECGQVRRVLALLKPSQSQILILRASGLSYKELAEALEVKLGGIGTMLNRAEAEFRERYVETFGKQEDV
jgi:RNA polymerase sigma-70 factor, ECF subfamily